MHDVPLDVYVHKVKSFNSILQVDLAACSMAMKAISKVVTDLRRMCTGRGWMKAILWIRTSYLMGAFHMFSVRYHHL